MKKGTYTKKQKNAIDSLVCNIDELTNKPRRLFSSLTKVAEAFIKDNDYKNEVIDTIHDFERRYYFFYTLADISHDLLLKSNETIKEYTGEVAFNKNFLYEDDLEKRRARFSDFENGVTTACKKLSKKMIDEIIEKIN